MNSEEKPANYIWISPRVIIALAIIAILTLGGLYIIFSHPTEAPAPQLQAQSVEADTLQSSSAVQISDGPPPMPEHTIWGRFCDSGLISQSPVVTVGGSRVQCLDEAGNVVWEEHCDDGWTVSVWAGNWAACYLDLSPSVSSYPITVSAKDGVVRIEKDGLVITVGVGE